MPELDDYLESLRFQREWELKKWIEMICFFEFVSADTVSVLIRETEIEIEKVERDMGF